MHLLFQATSLKYMCLNIQSLSPPLKIATFGHNCSNTCSTGIIKTLRCTDKNHVPAGVFGLKLGEYKVLNIIYIMEHVLRLYSPFPSSFNMPYKKSSKKSSEKQEQKQKPPQEPAPPTSPCVLSGLYDKYFPEWNIDSKQAEVIDRLWWAINI